MEDTKPSVPLSNRTDREYTSDPSGPDHAKTAPPRIPLDYAKTRSYVYLDLGARLLSSLALAILGLAGWLLQANNEQTRREVDAHDREERKYLPAIRSLTELELVLDDSARLLPQMFADHAAERLNVITFNERVWRASARLRYGTQSLMLPDSDPEVCVQPPGDGRRTMPCRNIRLQGGMAMFVEYLDLYSAFRWGVFDVPRAEVVVTADPVERRLRLSGSDTKEAIFLPISAESATAWEAWLHEPTELYELLAHSNVSLLSQDLRRGTTAYAHAVMVAHPNLGNDFVSIRSNALKEHRPLRDFVLLDKE